VAGQVRRGLTAAGFAVEKRPGFGRKRERLEARLAEAPAQADKPRRVAIIGGGIAGAAAARAVRALGGEPVVVEAVARGAGASGNLAALVTPRLDAGLAGPAELFAQAFRRAVALYAAQPGAVIAGGVLQFASLPRDADRFARIAASGLFERGELEPLAPAATGALLGEPGPAALAQRTALVVDPQALLPAWITEMIQRPVTALRKDPGGWSLLDAAGGAILQADAVIVAAGLGSAGLLPEVTLTPVRGQASWLETPETPAAAAWGGYVLPTRNGLLFGATHDRGEAEVDVRSADHDRNLATLAAALPGLAGRLAGRALGGRAAIRATTSDHMPLAGPTATREGVFLLTGFGSRGFSHAPLLAEHVAALAMGAPSPLPTPLAALVDPDRFRRRTIRRGS